MNRRSVQARPRPVAAAASRASTARFGDRLFAAVFWLGPTRLLSSLAGRLARSRRRWVAQPLIRAFCRGYRELDLTEAAQPEPAAYASFNAFFTRALASGQRPLPADTSALIAPVDGYLGACGRVRAGSLVQAKGQTYALADLVASGASARAFEGGVFATFYLAPANYHRVHVPCDARLTTARYLPGRLFGVNPRCVRAIPRLFTRNERLVLGFDTAAAPMTIVMIGAFVVGGIHTRWHGRVCPPHRRAPATDALAAVDADSARVARGDEIGRFSIGSSVIVLFGADAVALADDLAAGQPVRLGQRVGGPRAC